MAENPNEDLCIDVLRVAEMEDKPNFTQLQLALQMLGASPGYYKDLLAIMEKKFKLTPYIVLAAKHTLNTEELVLLGYFASLCVPGTGPVNETDKDKPKDK